MHISNVYYVYVSVWVVLTCTWDERRDVIKISDARVYNRRISGDQIYCQKINNSLLLMRRCMKVVETRNVITDFICLTYILLHNGENSLLG